MTGHALAIDRDGLDHLVRNLVAVGYQMIGRPHGTAPSCSPVGIDITEEAARLADHTRPTSQGVSPMQSNSQPLLDFPLFAGLSPAHQTMIAEVGRTVEFVKRQHLFTEDTPATGCWLIHQGRVGIETLVPGRGPVTIQTLGPNELVGWSWFVPPYRWQFTAVALTAVVATRLDTDLLRSTATENAEFGCALSRQMLAIVAQRLRHTRSRLLDLHRIPHVR